MAATRRQFAVCVRNDGYEVSLELRKIYEVLPDPVAGRHRQIRVVDESGEDYFISNFVVCSDRAPGADSTGRAGRRLASRL